MAFFLASLVAMSSVVVVDAAEINMDILPSSRLDIIPSLLLEQGWDSNIFDTSDGKTADFFFRAKPELAIQWNTPGAGVRLGVSVEETWYYSHPDANEAPTLNISLGLTGGQSVHIIPGPFGLLH